MKYKAWTVSGAAPRPRVIWGRLYTLEQAERDEPTIWWRRNREAGPERVSECLKITQSVSGEVQTRPASLATVHLQAGGIIRTFFLLTPQSRL